MSHRDGAWAATSNREVQHQDSSKAHLIHILPVSVTLRLVLPCWKFGLVIQKAILVCHFHFTLQIHWRTTLCNRRTFLRKSSQNCFSSIPLSLAFVPEHLEIYWHCYLVLGHGTIWKGSWVHKTDLLWNKAQVEGAESRKGTHRTEKATGKQAQAMSSRSGTWSSEQCDCD